MFDFALNRKDGDIVFKTNAAGFMEFWFIDGRDRIAQKLKIKLKMWLGEWFLDTSRGMPYLETILVKGVRRSTIEYIIKDQILAVEGVERIETFAMNIDVIGRTLRVDFTCSTKEGLIRDSYKLDVSR